METLTNEICENKGCSFWGCDSSDYKNFCNAVIELFKSNEVVYLKDQAVLKRFAAPTVNSSDLIGQLQVKTDGKFVDLYANVDEDGGYRFFILPEIVLSFIQGHTQNTFIAAYDIKSFSVEFGFIRMRKSYNISDMAHKERSYFLKYCDIKDSQVLAAGWEYETKNGYRDGRRQGNNSFRVDFNYSTEKYTIGDFSWKVACSCTRMGENASNAYTDFKMSYIDSSCVVENI